MGKCKQKHPVRDAVIVGVVFLLIGLANAVVKDWSGTAIFIIVGILMTPFAYWSTKSGWGERPSVKRIGLFLIFVELVAFPFWVWIGCMDGESPDDGDLLTPSVVEMNVLPPEQYDDQVAKLWDAVDDFTTNNVVETAFSNGNYRTAFEIVSNQVQKGCRVIESATSIYEYTAGSMLVHWSLSEVRSAMGRYALSDEVIDTAERIVDGVTGIDAAHCKQAIRADYHRQKLKMEKEERPSGNVLPFKLYGLVWSDYLMHTNDTLRCLASEAQNALSALDSECCPGEIGRPERKDGWRRWLELMKPNCIGRGDCLRFKWEIGHAIHSSFHETLRTILAMRITIAVTRYKNRHGVLPKGMDELVPVYFNHPLVDPCSHQPVVVDILKNKIRFGSDDSWHVYPTTKSDDEGNDE